MRNEVNLLAIPSGGDIKKYALKVFSQLFTTEEMAVGIDSQLGRGPLARQK